MTKELRSKFMAIVSNEDHMWNSLEAFLSTQINLKKFRRIFILENDSLVLTRRSVSNTVTLKVISSGNKADECIELNNHEKDNNRKVYLEYIKNHESEGELVDFDNSSTHNQTHLIINTKFTEFNKEFLSKLVYGYGSPFNVSVFEAVCERIKKGLEKDEIIVMFVRYGKGEYRSPSDGTKVNISRLFQGRNEGTNFSGDRYPIDVNGVDYSKKPFIQVHFVDIENKNNPDPSVSFPLISVNNPLTATTIKMVTGDNVYEE